jgi:hypothetical protein
MILGDHLIERQRLPLHLPPLSPLKSRCTRLRLPAHFSRLPVRWDSVDEITGRIVKSNRKKPSQKIHNLTADPTWLKSPAAVETSPVRGGV